MSDRQSPHITEAVYINAPPGFNVKNGTMPLVMVASIVIIAVSVTWFVRDEFDNIKDATRVQIGELKTEVVGIKTLLEANISATDTRLTRLEVEMERRTADRYTKTDHNHWCRTTELVNANNGWKCPSLEETHPLEYAPKLRGWDGTTGSTKRK